MEHNVLNLSHLEGRGAAAGDAEAVAVAWLMQNPTFELEVLHLSGGHITDITPLAEAAAGFNSLRDLDLCGCAALTAFSGSWPTLQSLKLDECSGLTSLTGSFAALRKLEMRRCTGLTCLAVLRRCPELRELNLASCTALSEVTLCQAAEQCPNLYRLWLSNLPAVTDAVVAQVARQSNCLKFLILAGCASVTDGAMEYVAGGCPLLEHLYVQGSSVTEAAVEDVQRRRPGLNIF